MDHDYLIREINCSYPLRMEQIKLHREMIGGVYFAEGGDSRYVLKIYRSFKTADALQSVRILDYLQAHSYPAVPILRTSGQESHILLEDHNGMHAAVLYGYVEGDTPDRKAEAELIGQQTAELHELMQGYPDQLHESMYDDTRRLFERFYAGYSKVRTLSDNEIYAVYDFIAVRHYQIISRIVRCQGLQSVSSGFCDEQYSWLMKWRELCMRKQH